MGQVKFNLSKTASNESMINLIFNYDYKRLKLSTSLKVPNKYWSTKKQRVKELMEFPDYAFINERLEEIDKLIIKLYRNYQAEGEFPSPKGFKKDFINLETNPLPSKRKLKFWDHFENFVEAKRKAFHDVRHYHYSLRKHLLKTQHRMRRTLSFGMIKNEDDLFINTWMTYLTFEAINAEGDYGLSPNTIGKENKHIKAFLNWCFDKNIISQFSLKKFPSITMDVDKIYITEEELQNIDDLELDDSEENIVRDLFVIGCETGFRYSDFTRIQENDIRNNEIHFRPKKTSKSKNNKVIVPISERLNRILTKYNYCPPAYRATNITEFNKVIRRVCEKAGMTNDIIQYKNIRGIEKKEVKKKFNEVSSHTCRRTFCTLKFLKGMPAQAIMKFTGHKTERNFLRYLKLDAQVTANKYREFF